jgi:outer membrane protein assembly factor BamB
VNKLRHLFAIGLTVLALAGCSLFGDKETVLPPTELVKFKQTLDLKKVWSAKVGGGSELLRLSLVPAGDGTRIYTASVDGVVSAFDQQSGKSQWTNKLEMNLSSGPGIGEGLVVVAGLDGYVVALNAADGIERWRANVAGESLAVPLVTDRGIVVYTTDGRLRMLSLFDGTESWTMQQNQPALTLRGTASPIIVGATVMVGFDNGRLIAINLDTGNTEWEAMMSPPSGRSDLERLADVDGRLQVVAQDIYASGYQGRVAALAAESGEVLWAREISTYVGIGADWNNIYIAADDGEIVAMQRRNGDDVWRSDLMIRREPSAPTSFGLTIAVGDFDGYVHFFSNVDGHPVARVRVGKGEVSGAPVVIGNRLYVQSESGAMDVFEIRQPKRDDSAPPIAEEES